MINRLQMSALGCAFAFVAEVGLSQPLLDDRELIGPHAYYSSLYDNFDNEEPFRPVGGDYSIISLQRRGGHSLKKEVFGYLPYWFRSRWNLIDYSLLSTIAYFSGEVESNGVVTETHGWPHYVGDPSASADVISMINEAHQHGVRVVLCITNFSGNEIHTLVSTPSSRSQFIQNAVALIQAGNADGLNIDFEGVQSASKPYLTIMMQELADSIHTRIPGSHVSCSPTDFDIRYNGGDWDLASIEPSVDMFFFQGYGYHYSGSSTTGPVGLLPNTTFWGSLNITTLIDNVVLTRIDTSKVVLGVPHYGRRWPAASENPKAATQGSGVAFYYPDALLAIAQYGRQWDAVGQNAWYRYQTGGQWYQGWYDDPQSMGYKYAFVFNRRLQGVGMWALGMDNGNHDIWDVLASYFVDSTATQVERHDAVPSNPWLAQNFPNPFNPTSTIEFSVPSAGRASLALFDIMGRNVRVLFDREVQAGTEKVLFSADDLSSGIYFYRLQWGVHSLVKPLVIIR